MSTSKLHAEEQLSLFGPEEVGVGTPSYKFSIFRDGEEISPTLLASMASTAALIVAPEENRTTFIRPVVTALASPLWTKGVVKKIQSLLDVLELLTASNTVDFQDALSELEGLDVSSDFHPNTLTLNGVEKMGVLLLVNSPLNPAEWSVHIRPV